jgi:hypothetical protein
VAAQIARKVVDDARKEREMIKLIEKVERLANAAKKYSGPLKVCLFVVTIGGISERAEANEQSVIEEATEEAFLPVEGKTISQTLEGFLGAIKDAIQGAFEGFAQRTI